MANKPLNSIKFPTLPDTYTLDHKANVDGYYEEMTVGDAEQLVSTQYVEDAVPYKFRTSGGSADIGNRAYIDKIVGGSLPWNQLVQNGNFAEASGWTVFVGTLTVDSNVGTYTVTDPRSWENRIVQSVSYIKDHVYLGLCEIKPSVQLDSASIWMCGNSASSILNLPQNVWSSTAKIAKSANTESTLYGISMNFYGKSQGDTAQIKNAMLFDLTQMFGTTIADYIYSLEQSTAGAGVAWFKKYFPNDYYPYNAGEMIHVAGLSSHDTVGFNAWDEEWELGGIGTTNGIPYADTTKIRSKNLIRVLPNTTYSITQPSRVVGIYLYDSNENFISYDLPGLNMFTTPSNAMYLRLGLQASYGTTYNHDICINLSWSGTRNGEYEPYQKHSYALDDSLTLRGIPKIDANGNLYYDGDEYESGGTVTRRYAEVTVDGSENIIWSVLQASDGIYCFYTSAQRWETAFGSRPKSVNASNLLLSAVADKLTVLSFPYNGTTAINTEGVYGYLDNSAVIIIALNSSKASTTAGFVSWLASNPLTIVYEVAGNSTTETAEPYNNVQIVDDWGTEEFVSTTIVPVGHETRYPQNLRDKSQHLPNLASADGDYAIRQTGSQMALVPLQDVKELPNVPSADGVYYLKVTVSNGTATLAWVAE